MPFARVCARDRCPEFVVDGGSYCGPHTAEYRAERQVADKQIKSGSPWRWVYKSPRWQALRKQVKAEQPWCATTGCLELTADVDHIRALQDGGAPFDRTNVQGLCKRHHSEKTNAEIRSRR